MDKYNNLTEEDIKILKKIGFLKDDFKQIDKSYVITRYAIFKDGDIDRCIVITPEKARKLLGDTDFLEGLTRSSFHWSTSLEIKGIDGYTVDFDSSELFAGKASGFTKLPSLKETYEDILRLKEDSKKYEFTDEIKLKIAKGKEHKLHRIIALKDFGNVKKGDLGGFIEKENNLSQEGNCWVYGEAEVFGNAQVDENARIYENAKVYGDAWVYGNAGITDDAKVYGDACIGAEAQVYENAEVFGDALVCGCAKVHGDAKVKGRAVVEGESEISKGTVSNEYTIGLD